MARNGPQWLALSSAVSVLAIVDIEFVSDADLPGETHSLNLSTATLRLNKSELWLKMPNGQLIGMNFVQATDFLLQVLTQEFRLAVTAMTGLRKALANLIANQASQYNVVLSNSHRLEITNIGNGIFGFAIILDGQFMLSSEFFDLHTALTCLSSDGTRFPSSDVHMPDLNYAFFTGPFLPNSDIDIYFHGSLRYACGPASSQLWRESATLRLTLKVVEVDTGLVSQTYKIDRAQSQIRFDSIRVVELGLFPR